ncbi:MAG: DMT family transporter [Pseudomonadota bacterium]
MAVLLCTMKAHFMVNQTRAGLLYALAGFVSLGMGDAIIKSMAGAWPAYAVAALRFSIGALALSLWLWRSEGPKAFVPQNLWLQIARGFCLATASLLFFSAIYIMPMAEAVAISFISPILTQAFGGLLLKEPVRPQFFAVSLVALVGVFIVLRPNVVELGWVALLPLFSAVFFSLLLVANRASAGQGSGLSMQVFVAGFCAPFLILVCVGAKLSGIPAFDFGWPSWDVVLRCMIVAVTATTAHWLAYIGAAKAGAAAIAPAIYVQLLVAIVAGWMFFEDIPDVYTLAGSALIIAAGLYLWRVGVSDTPPKQGLPIKR